MKVCSVPGCPAIQSESKCAEHRRESERARGTAAERGYGAAHRRLRAAYQRRLDAGEVFVCWRCATAGEPHDVDPSDWDLGHDDSDRSAYRGPECSSGNRGAPRRAS